MAPSVKTFLGPDSGGNFEHAWSNPFLDAHLLSDVGRKREHNEDSCVLCAPSEKKLQQTQGIVLAIADGMGGASAGELASRMTLSTVSEDYYDPDNKNAPKRLKKAIEAANLRVFKHAEREPSYHGMGTTVSVLSVVGDSAYIGQVGDSRVYLLRSGQTLMQLTQDHSLVAEQVRSGIITEEEAKTHSLKNLITRAVGIKNEVQVDLFSFKLQKGDTLMVCSDGLSNMVEDPEIEKSLALDTIQASARLLVGKALEEGGSDNITVGVLRVTEAPPRTSLDDGAEMISLNGQPSIMKRLRNLLP